MIGNRRMLRFTTSHITWLVIVCTLLSAILGEITVFGYRISGLAGWVIPFIVALMATISARGRIAFPYLLWLPWLFIVAIYEVFADADNSLQRSVMLVAPLLIGVAVSKVSVSESDLERFLSLCKWFAAAYFVVAIAQTGLIETGALPPTSGIAPEAITITLLCSLLAAAYAVGRRRYLIWWIVGALVPVVGLTRGPLVACALTLPLTLVPMRPLIRMGLLIAIGAAGLALFHTERVQQRMFYSGEGTLLDMRLDNPDFQTSGRAYIIEEMKAAIPEAPWFGHGANASQEMLGEIAEGLEHPHNDWLRLAYDYGYVGMVVFALTMLAQMWHARRAAGRTAGAERLLLYAGSSAFVPMAMLMSTDNIILYAAYFGNLQFVILGLAYAAGRDNIELRTTWRLRTKYEPLVSGFATRKRAWSPFRS